MASWKEIERFRRDVGAAKRLAAKLLAFHSDFTEWERDFLEKISQIDADYGLTTRQTEKLLQIRDDSELITEYRGFSIRLLIKQIYEARLDLEEGDETWIVHIRENYDSSIRRRHVSRLMRYARDLHIVAQDEDVAA